ncbi:MAG: hypothetical protein G3M78_09400 [Candidatus Nitrohelix vancouverensis]|uniref:Uncharacterized protein n=1 Tax=Candidatus Nitrohelix vancouverensis TaxID=2705534 RepID=A0A7T0G3T5_9BACT|nr:MAG: hypothetical protein G3M78_09400 [Candidatus Nitrohelix vancouverensis]
MGSLRIEEILPGMVASQDVKNRVGRVIMTAGSVITEKQIKTFKSWGVTSVDVQDAESEPVADAEPADALKMESNSDDLKKEMMQLFRFTNPRNPVVRELFKLCVDRKMKLTGKKGAADGS